MRLLIPIKKVIFIVLLFIATGERVNAQLGPTVVCPNVQYTYSGSSSGYNHNWTVTGGTIVSGAGTSSVVVTWNTTTPDKKIIYSYMPMGSIDPLSRVEEEQIIELPTVSSTTGAIRCDAGAVTLNAAGNGTLKWYSNASLTTQVATGTTYSPNISSTTTYYITSTNDDGCVSPVKTVTGTVNIVTAGTLSIYQTTSNCPKQGTLLLSNYSGTILQWESSTDQVTWTVMSTVNSATCAFSASQPTYYRVKVGSNGCTGYSPVFRVDPYVPAPGTLSIYQVTSTCNPKQGTLLLSNYSGTILKWESSTDQVNWIIMSTVNSSTCWFSANQTTYYRVLVGSGGCNAYSPVFSVDPFTPVAAGTVGIYQTTSNCNPQTGTLILNNYSGTILKWESSIDQANWTVMSTVNSSTIWFSTNQTTYYRALVSSNGCSAYSAALRVDGYVQAPGTISIYQGAATCNSREGTLQVTNYSGTILKWESSTNQVNWTVMSTVNSSTCWFSANQTSYYRVLVNSNNCSAYTAVFQVVVNTVNPGTISHSVTNSCGDPATGRVTLAGYSGTISQWERSLDNVNWGTFSPTAPAYYDYSVNQKTYFRVKISGPDCSVYTPVISVVINEIPNQPTTNNGIGRCGPGPLTLTASGATAGQTYRWYNSAGTVIAGVTGSSYTADFSAPGSHSVAIVSATGCVSQRSAINFNVAAIPQPPATTDARRQSAGPLILSAGGASGIYQFYQWYTTAAGGTPIVDANGAIITGSTYTTNFSATTTYYVTIKNTSGCESSRVSVTGTINPTVPYTNSIVTYTVLKEGVINVSEVPTLPVEEVAKEIAYQDGFGRTIQMVNWQASPSKKDVVKIVAYDGMNRTPKSYLPFTLGSDGSFKSTARTDQLNFYANTPTIEATPVPFAETVFEASSSSPVLEQGAAGTDWQIGSGHTKTVVTRPSNASDAVRYFEYNFTNGTITSPQVYNPGDLLVTEAKDEQGAYSYSYTDKKGEVVFTKSQVSATENALTYNVYDAFGNLRMVIQPEGVKELTTTGNWSLSSTFIDKWCFTYSYDEWGRQISTKIPGAQVDYIIYNGKSQKVAFQDGELRKKNQWVVTKYDALGRDILTAIYTSGAMSRSDMQTAVSVSTGGYEVRSSVNYFSQHGYTTSETYPSNNLDIVSVNYYDDYDFDFNASTANPVFTSLGKFTEPVPSYNTLGMATGSKQKVLETNSTFLTTSTFYDDKGNIIQTNSDNYLGGKDITVLRPDFAGTVLESVQKHTAGSNTVFLQQQFGYDHAKRLKITKHQVTKNATVYPQVILLSNNYNELSQLLQKQLHSDNSTDFLQSLDYRYNIRGWLTKINDANLSQAGDLFGEEIKYNSTVVETQNTLTPRYDGNISETRWKDAHSGKLQSYNYTYDVAGRLTAARYGAKSNAGFIEAQGFDENMSYDLNGNIKTLNRYQWQTGSTARQLIDALTYNYLSAGNQLKNIQDNAGTYAGLGFVNGATDSEEYVYDVNGNLITDKNKGITSITYNVFNLPSEIVIANKGKISYTYTASGTKLRKQVVPLTGETVITDYINGFEYKDNVLQFCNTAEGRVLLKAAPSYEYSLKDHLGNTRVNFDKHPTTGAARVIQKNDYYPYGMAMLGNYSSGVQNKNQYNGKELQDELGLSWYDYGARMYDPSIARWNALDPAAEKFTTISPYNYVLGDPIALIDPDGKQARCVINGVEEAAKNRAISYSRLVINPIGEVIDGLKNSIDQAIHNVPGLPSEEIMQRMEDYRNADPERRCEMRAEDYTNFVFDVAEHVVGEGLVRTGARTEPSQPASSRVRSDRQTLYGSNIRRGSSAWRQMESRGLEAGTVRVSPSGSMEFFDRHSQSWQPMSSATVGHQEALLNHFGREGYKMTPQQRGTFGRSIHNLEFESPSGNKSEGARLRQSSGGTYRSQMHHKISSGLRQLINRKLNENQ